MKKFIQTIRNIFKIEELRKRIVYTILLLLVYRLGSFIVLPGIDSAQLATRRKVLSAFSTCFLEEPSATLQFLRWV